MKLDLKATLGVLQRIGRKLISVVVWLMVPVIDSTQGAFERADVRAAITRTIAVGGLTWSGIKIASRDPEFMGAIVTLMLAIAAGIHHAAERKLNGVPTVPPMSPGMPPMPGPMPPPDVPPGPLPPAPQLPAQGPPQ